MPVRYRLQSLSLVLSTVLLFSAAPAIAQLTAPEQKCVNKSILGVSKIVKSFNSAALRCVKLIAKGTDPGPAADCTMAHPKIPVVEQKLVDAVNAYCSYPFPIDCPPPCDATDAGGATTGVDDDTELANCFVCIGANRSWSGAVPPASTLQGFNGALYQDASIPPLGGNPALAKCQQTVVKAGQSIFAAKLNGYVKCVKQALAAGAITPPTSCIPTAATSSKVLNAQSKLNLIAANPGACPPGPPYVFDNSSACAGLDGTPLADCIDRVAECKYCNIAEVLIGATFDCDLFDNGAVDGSCDP